VAVLGEITKILRMLIIFSVLVSCRGGSYLPAMVMTFDADIAVSAAGYPGIVMVPTNMSFTDLDWRTNSAKRIYLTLDNKEGYHINKATINLHLPADWEYIPDINSTRFAYYPASSKYEIKNFSGTNVVEWFEIRPGPNVSPDTYYLDAEARINFTKCSTCTPREITQNDSVKLVVAKTVKWTDIIIPNYPATVIAISAVITVIFGPNLYDKFKKRREARQYDREEEVRAKHWWRFWK
jgi:hypothetical protein